MIEHSPELRGGCSRKQCRALRQVSLASQSNRLNGCLPRLLQTAFVSSAERLEMLGVALRRSRGGLRGSLFHCTPVPI
jgi:hypothetical protein